MPQPAPADALAMTGPANPRTIVLSPMAYRGSAKDTPIERPEDEGIVGDLVQQFADPFAFYRELVQNAIDARASEIHVRLFVAGDGGVRVSVHDDGEGMTAEIIEERLLVLFRSGKEGRTDAIGKFGVGFVSVLALEPARVLVRSAREDGPSLTLHLYPDHRYELFESPAGDHRGTSVAIEIPRAATEKQGDASVWVEQSWRALTAWCRRARVPIHFLAQLEGAPTPLREGRVDAPLGLEECDVSVRHEEDSLELVVGLPRPGATPRAAFFNRGLTLFETTEPFPGPLSVVSFEVQDPQLEHTLSRDNVRRDAAFRRVMRVVLRVATTALPDAIQLALRQAAEEDLRRYARLLSQALAHHEMLPLDRDSLPLRLLEPQGGRHVVAAGALRRPVLATLRSPLTAHLAATGRSVLDAHALGTTYEAMAQLAGLAGQPPSARETLSLIMPIESKGADEALFERLTGLLERAHRAPKAIQWVRVDGAGALRLFLGGPPATEPYLAEEDPSPFRWLRRPALLLNAEEPFAKAARTRAQEDPELAAALLAHAILREAGALGGEAAAALADAALEQVLR